MIKPHVPEQGLIWLFKGVHSF